MTDLSPHGEAVRILTNRKIWLQVTSEPEFKGQRRVVIGYKTTTEKSIAALLIRLLGGDQKITKKDDQSNPGTLAIYMKPEDLKSASEPYQNPHDV